MRERDRDVPTVLQQPRVTVPLEEQLKCDHMPTDAYWLSRKKINRIKQIYANRASVGAREYAGVIVSDYVPAFRKDEIAVAFDPKRRYKTQSTPPMIFMAADPQGGGPSHMAVTTGYFEPTSGAFIVCYCILLLDTRMCLLESL